MSDAGAKRNSREDVYSKAVRAGKRTYFFDVKATRGNDLYLTITESKKRYAENGDSYYEKHKLFLYKEDFDKFIDGLKDAIDEIHEMRNGDNEYVSEHEPRQAAETDHIRRADYSDIRFEDLDEQS